MPCPDTQRTVFRHVGMPTQPGKSFAITVAGERIESVVATPGERTQWVCFPPLADLHVHANRAFTLGASLPRSLSDAIKLTLEMAQRATVDDYERNASRLFEYACRHGTARVRTHADVATSTGLSAVHGTARARERFASELDVEIVAFSIATHDPAEAHARNLLREACRSGAELLGAVPDLYPDPRRSIDAVLDLALELDVGVDLHLDEHLDRDRSLSAYLAQATLARGYQGRVWLSHACALSTFEREAQCDVAQAIADAGIVVIALPTTNLYLQDRGSGTPPRRGLTCAQELATAGVELRFASDNVRDVFYPYGSADLLETAWLAATAAHVEDPELLVRAITDGKAGIEAGREASFLLVRGDSLAEVLAERPVERLRVQRGAVRALQPR
jgi:cytosine/creatinine deaminase